MSSPTEDGSTTRAATEGTDTTDPGRRRRRWIGCGALSLFFAAAVWLVLRDDRPPRDDDLQPLPLPAGAPREQTVIAAIEEIHSAIPSPDWTEDTLLSGLIEAFYDDPMQRTSDTARWPWPERVQAHRAYYENGGIALDRVAAALERPTLGLQAPTGERYYVPLCEVVGIGLHLEGRAYCQAARGDKVSASIDMEALLLLGDRILAEGGHSLVHAMLAHETMEIAIVWLEALASEGALDPEVESRLMEWTPALERVPSPIAGVLAREYQVLKANIPEWGAKVVSGDSDLPRWLDLPIAFKANRTTARLAESFRRWIADLGRVPRDRLTPEETWFMPQERLRRERIRRALLRFNSGEFLVESTEGTFLHAIERFDELRLGTNALRLLVALRRHERLHGAIPADLDALLAAVPELGGLPRDPYSGEPFRFDPARRIFWSVGEDGVDGGAAEWQTLPGLQDRPRNTFTDSIWTLAPLPGR